MWLDIDLKTLNKRIKWNKKRPLLDKENNQKKINKLYFERKNIYKLANHRIDCDNLDKKNILPCRGNSKTHPHRYCSFISTPFFPKMRRSSS